MRKGTTLRNSQIFIFKCLIIINCRTIAAMNLNFGMNILPLSCYTRKEFQAPPISGVNGASELVDRIRKLPFYTSVWQLTAQDRRLAVASNLGSVK